MWYKEIKNGYITAIGVGRNDSQITKDEYDALMIIVHNRPAPPAGYDYLIRADTLEWELVELPPAPEPVDEEATATDYENALSELGVTV